MSSLGKKYTCFKCKTKFYDLNKEAALCPKCGADQADDPNPDPQEIILTKYRRPSAAETRSSARRDPAAGEDEEGEEEFDEEFLDETDAAIEDEDEDFGELDEVPEEAEEEDYD